MVDIKTWIKIFTEKVKDTFGERVWFVGLQGSYGRGEATETSDIDVVVILDELSINDLNAYRNMIQTLPDNELVCGFISGKGELLNWETSDLFQFYYDTTPIVGNLDLLLKKIDKQSINRAIRIGACNIYHACAHNYVLERSNKILCSLYKSAIFVLQAICFYETGKYIKSKADLYKEINPSSAVLETELKLKSGEEVDFEQASNLLLNWSKDVIAKYKE